MGLGFRRSHSSGATRVRGLFAALAISLAVMPTLTAPPVSATTTDFPAGARGFHTYAEMSSYVAAVAAAHPNIVRRFSIGRSYKGRELWAVEVTSSKLPESAKPGVMFDGLTHAREHLSLEMTIAILRWLVTGYGVDSTITRLVNTRSIFIIFAVNPDGAEYDISGGRYHGWRKNRQPNAGTTAIGTDLNRNYSYKWGCCGLVSTSPSSSFYRGAYAFSAPETRAVRDFVASRVINGRQQIRAGLTFHTSGRLILWPYGYTKTDIPTGMTRDDHSVIVALARGMASRNVYHAEQASDLYVDSGTERDWAFGRWHIFSYTIELGVWDYPSDTVIGPETRRNKSAILWFIGRAACPYALIGKAAQYCS
jgi:carboxypeptidase T